MLKEGHQHQKKEENDISNRWYIEKTLRKIIVLNLTTHLNMTYVFE